LPDTDMALCARICEVEIVDAFRYLVGRAIAGLSGDGARAAERRTGRNSYSPFLPPMSTLPYAGRLDVPVQPLPIWQTVCTAVAMRYFPRKCGYPITSRKTRCLTIWP
jgi:hypothetical protein